MNFSCSESRVHSGETCCCLTAYISEDVSCTSATAQPHQQCVNSAKATEQTPAAALDGLDPSDHILRLWRKRKKLLKSAKWMRTRHQLTGCTRKCQICRASAQREGGNLNKEIVDYVQLIHIICFWILRFPSGVCYWMAVLAQGRSQESEWFSREYRVAILFPWSPSEGHYLAG